MPYVKVAGVMVRGASAAAVCVLAFLAGSATGVPAATPDIAVKKLSEPQVSYRMTGVAYVRAPGGHKKFVEAPLETAALGAGDRIRYLVVATSVAKTPQLAGIAIHVPEYTVWEPTPDLDGADVVAWSTGHGVWRTGPPSEADAKAVRTVRWVLAQRLRPGLSTAFVFQLHLTGPYSDRTHDLNQSRATSPKSIEALTETQIRAVESIAHVDPDIADPLGLREAFADPQKLLAAAGGALQARIGARNGIEYGVTGNAYQRDGNVVREVPLSGARLHAGDRVRFAFSAKNAGDVAGSAGSEFWLPPYARFESARSTDGVFDVSADGSRWTALTQRGAMQPRVVRWTHSGPLGPGATAHFTVSLVVAREPSMAERIAKGGQGSFEPLSASVIQSILFTKELTTGTAREYRGVPLSDELRHGRPSTGGFVNGNARPIEAHQPGESMTDHAGKAGIIATITAGALIMIAFGLWTLWRDRSRRKARGAAWNADGTAPSPAGPASTNVTITGS